MKFTTVCFAGLMVLISMQYTNGEMFSVDITSDELVLIDPTSGNVCLVGSLQYDASDIDLAMYQGRLFGLNTQAGIRVDLLEINTASGAVMWYQQVSLNDNPVVHAEGLAADTEGLIIGFHQSGDLWLSSVMGNLGLNGAISNPVDYGGSVDFDGLTEQNDIFYFSDCELPTSATEVAFYSLNSLPHEILRYPLNQHVSNDLVVVGSHLFSLSDQMGELWSTNIETAEFEDSISLSRPGTYFGLAIPEPLSTTFLAMGALSLLAYTWRRKRR